MADVDNKSSEILCIFPLECQTEYQGKRFSAELNVSVGIGALPVHDKYKMICTIISLAPPGTKVFVERAFVSNERFSRWLDPSLKDLFIRVFSYDFNNDSMGPCLLCADNISDELRKKFKDLKWKIEEIRAANFPKTA